MPTVQTCPHCGEEIIQADVEEFAKSQKEEELDDLFYDQPDIKRLLSKERNSGLLALAGMFGGALLATYGNFHPILFFAAMALGATLGMIPNLLLNRKLSKMQRQFKLEHQPTPESGN